MYVSEPHPTYMLHACYIMHKCNISLLVTWVHQSLLSASMPAAEGCALPLSSRHKVILLLGAMWGVEAARSPKHLTMAISADHLRAHCFQCYSCMRSLCCWHLSSCNVLQESADICQAIFSWNTGVPQQALPRSTSLSQKGFCLMRIQKGLQWSTLEPLKLAWHGRKLHHAGGGVIRCMKVNAAISTRFL